MWQRVVPLLALATLSQALDWDAAYAKANAALTKLTQDEKLAIVTGVGWTKGPCVGNTGSVNSIGYPSLCLQDGPLGIRFVEKVTAFPAGVNAASTWDVDLIHERGVALGAESKALGINVHLGPVAGALGKIPFGGRNWEGFSPDPYFAGIAMAETIKGMQESGVQACAKHFLLNEQEKNRETMDTSVDDRTLHELYLWPFADAVHAGVATVMCSYNKFKTFWACESEELLNHTLKGELGFRGTVISDWNAQHSTALSANTGLDMTMPGTDFNNPPGSVYWGVKLGQAITTGEVPQSRLDDMVRRNLAGWYGLGQDKNYPPVTWNSFNNTGGGPNVQGDHKRIARTIARDSIVLLKNINNTLPLIKPKSLAIVGQDAIVNPAGANACADRGCNIGHLAMGWGSGTAQFPYLIAPLDAIRPQAIADNTTLATSTSDDPDAGANAARDTEFALVFITSDSGEGYITVEGNQGDRLTLDPWHDCNDLVEAVAAVNKKTIVVVNSVGPIILETILAQPNVLAIVWAGIAGQESGNALVDVLYGGTSPSGKLPYTIARRAADYGTTILPGTDTFDEGLFVDYRHFDKAAIEPRYEFGFGLSYSKFTYSTLILDLDTTPGPAPGPTGPGGPLSLFSSIGHISATITNTGRVAAAEVAQLYITLPASTSAGEGDIPVRQLRGFAKISLAPGESGVVSFVLRRRDVSYWEATSMEWVVPRGVFGVVVGASSRDLRLEGRFSVDA
ncbi:putative beta-glucosidase L [Pseudovirgaria hyperparasitica]|uniref:beta-glucosidase n=1 Tax=Pseudovirgaria hyperparasitica TaxID=470096 RepID=A0A6A6WMX1_9PEZI|nr:putative beta-glucosidase L [Pseudovirgaria hyperparasitica]KAF2763584.1 putative beta-glucosidase L [Pseudovirgaria hyperparasitica]